MVLTDDIASSGETLIAATRLLKSAGAATVEVAVAHALFGAAAGKRLREAGARRVVSTDSIRHPSNGAPLAAMLADALKDEIPR